MSTDHDNSHPATRLDYKSIAPEGYQALSGLETYVRHCGLERTLLELVKLRASQLNGCAYCIDMHTQDARVRGETEQRLYALATPFCTARERAALAWTETLTKVPVGHVPGTYQPAASAGKNDHNV